MYSPAGWPPAHDLAPMTHEQRFEARWAVFEAWLNRSVGQQARYAMREIADLAERHRREMAPIVNSPPSALGRWAAEQMRRAAAAQDAARFGAISAGPVNAWQALGLLR